MHDETSIAIEAPVAEVWAVLADVERWPEWTGSITSIAYTTGDHLAVGNRVRIKQPGMPALLWDVTAVTPLRSFAWQARSGGLTTLATHHLTPEPDGCVTVRFGVRQRGLLAGPIGLLTGRRTRRYVRMEAEGLKRRCEATTAPAAG